MSRIVCFNLFIHDIHVCLTNVRVSFCIKYKTHKNKSAMNNKNLPSLSVAIFFCYFIRNGFSEEKNLVGLS